MSESSKPKRSLAGIAGIVAIATLISKVVGLLRTVAIGAAFGTTAAKSSYDIASIIPGFFLILLGGINGPFHSAMVSSLSKRTKEEAAPLVETVSTLIGGIFFLATVFLVIAAPLCIDLLAPGLQQTVQGAEVRAIAIQGLRIMAPMAWFAGMIGIGFGALNAADLYWLPSVSPLLSSLTIIIGVGLLALAVGDQIVTPQYALIGGVVLSSGALLGTVLQWLAQFWAQRKAGLGRLRLRFNFRDPAVRSIFAVMGPALFSSGMFQINVITDLFFASFLPNSGPAIASFDYANLLIQTPLGILSNVILVPLFPVFSRLTDPEHWDELKARIRQGLLLTAIAMLPLSGLIIALAKPIVQVVYERGAFRLNNASQLVASILVAYAIGMFVYLGRDVLVRVFYALGDGETPFRISVVNIFLNGVFDFILIKPLGAPGLVLATVCVNTFSVLALLWFLNKKLNGLPLREWSFPIFGLTFGSVVSGSIAWATLNFVQQFLGQGFIDNLIKLVLAGGVGLIAFIVFAMQLKLPEVDMFADRILQRFPRR
ncbi:murein biosynthesis integral membrane protein MurJ [Myxacorys almedinensis]|uniref:Probable lipid II flippase MurJ n=1 Tax=Myxacorys almedinensis A TaxID=2690445 RepID=A0A8J7Z8G4_9CYAN|nr:murein biosynthesis integral membrane protein MurJ [Myxacorys almedinensis A]